MVLVESTSVSHLQMQLNDLKYLVSEPHFNGRWPHNAPQPPNSALPPTQSLSSERLGSFYLPAHTMVIPSSVPLFIWLPKSGMHSPILFPDLQFELSFKSYYLKSFSSVTTLLPHLSLEFAFPLICTISLSTELILLVIQCAALTLLHVLSPLPNTPTLSLALDQAGRIFNKQKVLQE